MTGLHFWATGYCVSTVGLDEETIQQYIRDQEELQRRKGETDQKEFDFEETLTAAPTGLSLRQRPPRGAFLKPPATREVDYSSEIKSAQIVS